jgi:2-keto-4-pentenoate hydratase/2-oxohepta-3-ene-1,7-dioic acid hydratase in catechol pathway
MSAPSLVLLDDYRVAVATPEGAQRDVCAWRHPGEPAVPSHALECLTSAAMDWPAVEQALASGSLPVVATRSRRAPVHRPLNVFGAPVNYRPHQGELGADRSPAKGTVRELGLFVKAAGSVSGPDDPIELPDLPGRECHFEGEIAVVIGRYADLVSADDAISYVAGFTGALDITLRLETDHREERSMRKSYKTFSPLGPGLLPAALVSSIDDLGLRLSVNGEERQHGRLGELIMPVAELVALASSIVPLHPGDVILTGTPAGVGQIVPGDVVEMAVDGLPPMSLEVTSRKATSEAAG